MYPISVSRYMDTVLPLCYPVIQQYDLLWDVGGGAVRVYRKRRHEMSDYEREQRREAERRERMERETIEPMDEPVGVYDRGERHDDPVERVGDRLERAGERIGDQIDPYDRTEQVDPYNRPERVGSNSGLWLTVGIIVLVVIALIVVMLLLPLL